MILLNVIPGIIVNDGGRIICDSKHKNSQLCLCVHEGGLKLNALKTKYEISNKMLFIDWLRILPVVTSFNVHPIEFGPLTFKLIVEIFKIFKIR